MASTTRAHSPKIIINPLEYKIYFARLWSAKFILRRLFVPNLFCGRFGVHHFVACFLFLLYIRSCSIKKIEPQNKFGTKIKLQNKFGTKIKPQNKFGTKIKPQNNRGTKINRKITEERKKFVLNFFGRCET